VQYKIAQGLKKLIKIRQRHKIFGQGETHILDTNNPHVFAYTRHNEEGRALLAICNFSERTQNLDGRLLDHIGEVQSLDLITGKPYQNSQINILLIPYQVMWLSN
jgi:amylosucrase